MDRQQLGELILASSESMYRVAKSLLGRDADCEDAISETIVKAFEKVHTLRTDQYGKTWLIRILMNECYMIMRRGKKTVSLEDYPLEDGAGEERDYSDLYHAITRLPCDMRLCITLYYVEGYSVKEIAGLLKVTESTVKNRMARARKRLKCELDEEARG
ncbi:MAG: sigma-70 family RNA polymerase sigma factor [Candidatus Choladocola sp.]|nr:sigma-70 family RNA polymerase sigma factor [Candidatus Choladocola sp.]